MSVIHRVAPSDTGQRADTGAQPSRSDEWLDGALLVAGAAMVVLVAHGAVLGVAARVALVGALVALAIGGARRGNSRTRGIIAVVAGTVATVVGLGIGVSFVVRSGPSPTAIAGLVELASGVVLLIAGTVALVRRTHGWRRWAAIPIAFVVLQFVAVPLFGAVVITNVPPDDVGPTTPADHGLAYDEVTFAVDGGERLAAWYIPSANRAALVVLAGSGSTRSGALDHAVVLARHGYGALVVDNRGHGRSEGVAMDTGWFGDDDIEGAIGFLARQPDVDPTRIGVVGLSMGGEEAIGAAGVDDRIRAVVAEGATGRSDADDVDVPSGVTGGIERVTGWEQFRIADLLTDATPPPPLVDAVRRSSSPMLLIAGRGEQAANRRFRDAAPDRVALWELPDTPHVGARDERPQEWERRVTSFLDEALIR